MKKQFLKLLAISLLTAVLTPISFGWDYVSGVKWDYNVGSGWSNYDDPGVKGIPNKEQVSKEDDTVEIDVYPTQRFIDSVKKNKMAYYPIRGTQQIQEGIFPENLQIIITFQKHDLEFIGIEYGDEISKYYIYDSDLDLYCKPYSDRPCNDDKLVQMFKEEINPLTHINFVRDAYSKGPEDTVKESLINTLKFLAGRLTLKDWMSETSKKRIDPGALGMYRYQTNHSELMLTFFKDTNIEIPITSKTKLFTLKFKRAKKEEDKLTHEEKEKYKINPSKSTKIDVNVRVLERNADITTTPSGYDMYEHMLHGKTLEQKLLKLASEGEKGEKIARKMGELIIKKLTKT